MSANSKIARTATVVLLAFAVASNAQYYGTQYGGSYSGNYGGSSSTYGGYEGSAEEEEPEQTTGVFYDWGAHEGYNFFSVLTGRNSYIVDNDGKVRHEWEEPDGLPLALHSEFTDEGTLVRSGRVESKFFNEGSSGSGVIREYNKQGDCIWEFRYSNEQYRLTRTFDILPNGNVIAAAWQNHVLFDARVRGYTGEEQTAPDGYWSYTLVEVPRTGHKNLDWDNTPHDGDVLNTCKYISDENDIVWKWDSFDHSANYINEYLWDINLEFRIDDIEYYPDRDHFMIACRPCGEVFIIDHSIEYKKVPWDAHFIYRWGNPSNYGKEGKQKLDTASINWVQDRYGWDYKEDQEGSVVVFNLFDPEESTDDKPVSTIAQFTPPYDKKEYTREKDGTYGPKDFDWKIEKYQEQQKVKSSYSYKYEYEWFGLLSEYGSFAQELPNKNILATSTSENFSVEIAQGERAYWKYTSPFYNDLDRDHIDTPDLEAGKFDELEICDFDDEDLCTRLYRLTRYSKDHSGIQELHLGFN